MTELTFEEKTQIRQKPDNPNNIFLWRKNCISRRTSLPTDKKPQIRPKPDNSNENFIWRKIWLSRRRKHIVRFLFFTSLLLQQIEKQLSGFCLPIVRRSKEFLLNRNVVVINKLITTPYLVNRDFLREQKVNVRFYNEKKLTIKTGFFQYQMSGFEQFILHYLKFYFCGYVLSGLEEFRNIVRFYKITDLTFNIHIVRFYIEKKLTFNIYIVSFCKIINLTIGRGGMCRWK